MSVLSRFKPFFQKGVEAYTWELHFKNGFTQTQYVTYKERRITDFLEPVPELDHHFKIDGLKRFALIPNGGGDKAGIDFTDKRLIVGQSAMDFAYTPEYFYFFRRTSHSVNLDSGSGAIFMEFHFGIAAEDREQHGLILKPNQR